MYFITVNEDDKVRDIQHHRFKEELEDNEIEISEEEFNEYIQDNISKYKYVDGSFIEMPRLEIEADGEEVTVKADNRTEIIFYVDGEEAERETDDEITLDLSDSEPATYQVLARASDHRTSKTVEVEVEENE